MVLSFTCFTMNFYIFFSTYSYAFSFENFVRFLQDSNKVFDLYY